MLNRFALKSMSQAAHTEILLLTYLRFDYKISRASD